MNKELFKTCTRKFFFKRTKNSITEFRIVSCTNKYTMNKLLNKAEKENNPSILLGKDVKEVNSLWL
jgi:hypothetical protein